ncbi:MAG: triose-phosphate isomerase [Oceanospirillaceae bacterium]|nr:triose-phosphate isomerase [Oceanospirillaceae bacterium]
MRKPMVAGNWKMNGASEFASLMSTQLNQHAASIGSVDVVVCPPTLYLAQVQNDAISYASAAQNVHFEEAGAYTGETSVAMLKDLGVEYVLVGHSERREMFADTDAVVANKVAAVIARSLVPILCIGESLEQRRNGEAFEVVKKQLLSALQAVTLKGGEVVVAYEPIWAIGTGETATPEQAQEIHAYIRSVLAAEISAQVAEKTRILYGGSVSAATAAELFSQQDIDGGLVGGASLKIADFKTICSAAADL